MIKIYPKKSQAYGEFNNGEIIENKPIGFPQDNGPVKPYSNLFYWAFAEANNESTIGLHPHKGFEIMSFVLSGSIDHYDTKINKWLTLKKGDVQLIKSGSGIYHSEKNAESEDTKLYQIWIEPREMNVTPRWDSKDFPAAPVNDALALLVSGDKKDIQNGALYINQDAYIYGGVIQKDARITHKIHQQAYILLSKGAAEINGVLLEQGDGASLDNAEDVTITAQQDTEILIIDVPKAQH